MSDRVQKITEQIMSEAAKESSLIQDRSQHQIAEIENAAQKEIGKIRSRIEESGKNNIDNQNKRLLGQARLNAKMKLLNAQQVGLDEVFAHGKLKLEDLNKSNEYSSILADLTIVAGIALGGGDLQISVRKMDTSKLSVDVVTKKITDETGVSTKLSLDNVTNTKFGGVIAKKGEIWVDNTFESIIDRREDVIRNEIAKILFY